MKKVFLAFRGRNTEGIIADARKVGIIPADTPVIIVAGDDDKLSMSGDKPVSMLNVDEDQYVVLVANGGRTCVQVPVVAEVATRAGAYVMYDIQPDGAVVLAASTWPVDPQTGVCSGCGRKVQATDDDPEWDYCECPTGVIV